MRSRAEAVDAPVRHALLLRMQNAFARGERDPELIFLGARYAASLGLEEQTRWFAELLGERGVAELLLRRDGDRNIDLTPIRERIATSPAVTLAGAAAAAYAGRDLAAARLALEDLLVLQADRADVLWNLLVVTSEQQDAEAYDRYWRRLAELQLVRMLRREPGAREELVRFYTFVATATDRLFAELPVKVADALATPGLLPRWLEAHAALAWLEGPRPALCRFWFRAFYPQLEPFLVDGKTARRARAASLSYDPALKLLTRFVEWSRVQFALGDDDVHAETVRALAHCVGRIDWQPYVARLTAVLRGPDHQEGRPFRQAMQEAVSLPLGGRLGELLDAKNWSGIVDEFGDLAAAVTPTIRLFLALACCELDDAPRGYQIALRTLPDLAADDLQPESQVTILWRNVLQANLQDAMKAEVESSKKVEAIRQQLRGARTPVRAAAFAGAREAEVDDVLRQIEQRKRVDAAIEATQKHLQKQQFMQARAAIRKLEDEPKELAELKAKLLSDIDQIEQQHTVQERVRALVAKGEFDQAHKVINTLPSEEPGRKAIARAVNEAQKEARQHEAIEKAADKAKAHVEKGQFAEARRDVRDVPEPLKKQFLAQIDEAEQAARTHANIEKAIDDAKVLVGKGKFNDARRALAGLPDDLKKKLLQQVDEAEREAKTAAVVESAVEEAKRHLQKGKFDQARKAVRNVPEPLKKQFLGQIDEAESQLRKLNDENAVLRRALSSRGIGNAEIDRLARLNELDTSNPAALNALLQAIHRQLG